MRWKTVRTYGKILATPLSTRPKEALCDRSIIFVLREYIFEGVFVFQVIAIVIVFNFYLCYKGCLNYLFFVARFLQESRLIKEVFILVF